MSGQPLAASDLVKLHFHRNTDGQYACPVLYKPFTQHTHIVAIKPTGNVYCYDAVKQMNLKTNHLCDLLDDTPFTRADVAPLPDDEEVAQPHRAEEAADAAEAGRPGSLARPESMWSILSRHVVGESR